MKKIARKEVLKDRHYIVSPDDLEKVEPGDYLLQDNEIYFKTDKGRVIRVKPEQNIKNEDTTHILQFNYDNNTFGPEDDGDFLHDNIAISLDITELIKIIDNQLTGDFQLINTPWMDALLDNLQFQEWINNKIAAVLTNYTIANMLDEFYYNTHYRRANNIIDGPAPNLPMKKDLINVLQKMDRKDK